MATPIGFDPTYTAAVEAPFRLGAVYSDGPKEYIYVLTADAVNATNGMVAEKTATAGVVTVDRSGGSSLGRIPAGVFVGSVTAGQYCFIQTRGRHAAVKDAAGGLTPVGKKVTTHATTDGDAAPSTAYTDHWIGVVSVVTSGGVAGVDVKVEF